MSRILFTGVRILDCTGAEPYPGEVLVDGNVLRPSLVMGSACREITPT